MGLNGNNPNSLIVCTIVFLKAIISNVCSHVNEYLPALQFQKSLHWFLPSDKKMNEIIRVSPAICFDSSSFVISFFNECGNRYFLILENLISPFLSFCSPQ